MHPIVVRQETPEDIRAIDVVNLSAFEGEAEARLVGALRKSPDFIPELSLVAELNGRIVGHVLLTRVRLRKKGGVVDVLALAPMSVVPSQSHRGIGSELIEAAVDKARKLGFGAIVVVGHPDYYRRFGFGDAAQWGLHCELPAPEEAVTAMELTPGALTGGGTVSYPSEFGEIFGKH